MILHTCCEYLGYPWSRGWSWRTSPVQSSTLTDHCALSQTQAHARLTYCTRFQAPGFVDQQLAHQTSANLKRSAAMATEPLQPRDLVCGTPFRSSCAIQTSPTDCLDDSWSVTFFGEASVTSICRALEKHLLTYLLTYIHMFSEGPVK